MESNMIVWIALYAMIGIIAVALFIGIHYEGKIKAKNCDNGE